MNPDSPFTVHGDETLEARIVAWVLGEASAFEEAELERLCEERPELLVFRHRMRALHGLLTEAEKQQPDEGWKLPEEKRKVLDEILGEKQGEVAQVMVPKQAGSSARRILLGLAACLLLSLIVLSFFAAGSASIQKARRLAVVHEGEKHIDFLPRETSPAAAMNDELAALEQGAAVGDRSPLAEYRSHAESRFSKNEPASPAVGNLKRNPAGGAGAAFNIPDAAADLGQIAEGSVSSRTFATPPNPAASPAPAQSESSELLASRSLEAAKPKTVPLRPEFPPELIEGTPKPIILPPIADTSAEDNLTVQPQSTDRAVRSRISDSTGEVSAIAGKLDSVTSAARVKRVAAEGATNQPAIPAPADTPAAMPSLSSLGDRIEISSGGIVAESKPESGDSLGLVAGKKGEAPAQPATAAPAASDAETDLAKLMSGGRVAGGENFFSDSRFTGGGTGGLGNTTERGGMGGGFIQEEIKSYAGMVLPSDRSNEQAGNSSAGTHLWSNDTSDIQADAEYDFGFATGRLPTLAQGSHDGWESAKAAEFGRKVPEVRFAGESEAPPPSLSDSEVAQSSTADTPEHAQSVDTVRKNLHIAEGNFNLGKYDDAKKSYEDVLRADPYNSAARRGLERINQAKADYYRAAYDHTRAELLSQVDSAWEIAVPEEQGKIQAEDETLARNDKDAPELPKVEARAKELSKTPTPITDAAKPDLSKLIEEIAASEEPYSTFSLNISDASFQIAQAAMAKGERPDPAGVKVEQFYNAVDYGDPAPAAGEPVAVNIEQSAHPVIPGRNLVRVALKTAAAGRAASQPLHLTLLVDQSGSMSREDRRTAMKQALGSLGGLLSNNDTVTVVGFSRTPHLLADGLAGDQSKKLPDLINVEASEGGTNLEEAMKLGEQLAARHKQPGAQNRIVLFTDGAANLGNADPEKLAERVKQLRQKGIALDIAGIAAADLNDELLAELARNGNGRYYVVGKGDDENFAKQLAGAFRPAAENVKVQVRFNPERVARYKLIGFEKDRLKTEDFRNDAVDAAEMAAEEAGVAIYQIEPIAGGKGEIGEVSVRFRDTAAGQMVERAWTISNDPSTPAFDRASPSMQLATFAMLAAEKLKGGAYAEAIDFKQLSAPQANVKRFYGDQGRPAEVLRMVDALK